MLWCLLSPSSFTFHSVGCNACNNMAMDQNGQWTDCRSQWLQQVEIIVNLAWHGVSCHGPLCQHSLLALDRPWHSLLAFVGLLITSLCFLGSKLGKLCAAIFHRILNSFNERQFVAKRIKTVFFQWLLKVLTDTLNSSPTQPAFFFLLSSEWLTQADFQLAWLTVTMGFVLIHTLSSFCNPSACPSISCFLHSNSIHAISILRSHDVALCYHGTLFQMGDSFFTAKSLPLFQVKNHKESENFPCFSFPLFSSGLDTFWFQGPQWTHSWRNVRCVLSSCKQHSRKDTLHCHSNSLHCGFSLHPLCGSVFCRCFSCF